MLKRLILFTILVLELTSISNKLYCQDSSKKNLQLSARYSFYHNYKIMHHSPVIVIIFDKHNFYFGPEYSLILKRIKGDPVDIYEKESFGINFGYRYYWGEKAKRLNVFSQLNYAIFKVKYKEYQHGPPFVTEHKDLIIENTISLGVDYNIWNNFHVYSGAGIGSFAGFFLITDAFLPTSYIGLEYVF